MDKDSRQPPEATMILACAGGSKVGQLANQAAVELTQEGFGKLFCLAGIGSPRLRRRLYRFSGGASRLKNFLRFPWSKRHPQTDTTLELC